MWKLVSASATTTSEADPASAASTDSSISPSALVSTARIQNKSQTHTETDFIKCIQSYQHFRFVSDVSIMEFQIVTAILEERWRKCARRRRASASASRATAERDATSASRDISDTPSASRAIAAHPEARRPSAISWANVPAIRASPAADATSAALAISNIRNASVTCFHHFNPIKFKCHV